MPIKVYTSGNYIVVDNGTTMSEYAKGYTTYTYVQSTQTFTIKETVGGEYKITRTQILAGDITDEPGTTAFTFNSFVTFLRENTGFKTAPGGSGAAPIGATLLKTGQITSYRTGDDGDIEAGRAVDFTTLSENNPFGNTKRFTDTLGGIIYADDIVIDWSTYDGSTVLGYRRTSAAAVTWNNAIDGALAVSIGLFTTGWRLPNVNEMQNIMNFQRSFTSGAFNYFPFNNADTLFWTSNTLNGSSSNKFYVFNFGFGINFQDQANTLKYIPVRTFTVSETTLS